MSTYAFAFSPVGLSGFTQNTPKKESFLSTGFLHSSAYNADFDQSFYTLGLKIKKKLSNGSELVIDAFGLLKVAGAGGSSYSLKEFYYKKNISTNFSYSIGRKITNWSHLEYYLPTGFWNNSWDFNKSVPVQEGLFGAFLDVKLSEASKIKFFASPLSIPKLTSHYKFNDDGSVDANTAWFVPPPSTVDYQGRTFATRYSLDLDAASIVLQPQLGATYDWENSGFLMKASYLYGPSKDVDMAINFRIVSGEEGLPVEIDVIPSTSYVHKASFEFGRKWSKNSRTIISASYKERAEDLPLDITNELSYVGLTSGGVYQILHEISFLDKALKLTGHIVENTETQNISNGELDEFLLESLSVPFRYRRGGGLKLDYKINSRLKGHLYGYYDLESEGVLGDVKISTNWKKTSLSAGFNFVEALNSDSKGFYKDFRENDSYHMGASYVF